MYLRECLFGIAVLCGCATPAGAQSPETLSWAVRPAAPAQAPPGDEPLVGLDELIQAAIEHSPAIAAARHRVDAARQRIGEEHALPDPMRLGRLNSSGNPLPGAGLGTEPTANIGVMVTQPIPYAGKRDLRAAVAGHDVDAEAVQLDCGTSRSHGQGEGRLLPAGLRGERGSGARTQQAAARHAAQRRGEPLLRRTRRAARRDQGPGGAHARRAAPRTAAAGTRTRGRRN